MGKKTESLELLFREWETAQHNESNEYALQTINGKNITRDHFRRDGIIDEEIFENEKRKILFISAEANDDGYSAKQGIIKTNTVDDYRKYSQTGVDDWIGKMRIRTSALYKIAAGLDKDSITDAEATLHYAVMDLNKRGGTSTVDNGVHLQKYCELYKKYIVREIEIINPDIIIWLHIKTFDMGIPQLLGATGKNPVSFLIMGKNVPIIRMWHTAYRYGMRYVSPLEGYDAITGSLCAKLKLELKKYGLLINTEDMHNTQLEKEGSSSIPVPNVTYCDNSSSPGLAQKNIYNCNYNKIPQKTKSTTGPKIFILRKIIDWILFVFAIMFILVCFSDFKRNILRASGELISFIVFSVLVMPIPSILSLWENSFGEPKWRWIRILFLFALFIIAIMFAPNTVA